MLLLSVEGPPSSAEEYLARVRYESRKLPDVVTAKIDPSTITVSPHII
jgi:hypothetical protein